MLRLGITAGLVAVLIAGCLAIYNKGRMDERSEWVAEQSEAAEQQATLRAQEERAAREKEQRNQDDIEAVRAETEKIKAQQQADARSADATRKRLLEQTDRLAASLRSCSTNPGIANGSQTRANTADLLAELLRRADERAGELAQIADRSRIAGSACQSAYDSIRNNQ
ncbi:hypothetical protein 3S11_22 [uncultured Caudovirales phage]|uniref:DUF2514 domain-containing protein n=1 Tax=uncultured Caudovirales phage TaxID=2100421 RepID=A0A2H4J0Y8_9CAUD|nr:DUF2514 family protein [Pseudomonas luteola]ASN68644.1 hypothetical protein 3S11_22 [uncultured Caudovirales phage]QEU28902.1 DUF2514 domain-containing protein [Pseudomonas luteola]